MKKLNLIVFLLLISNLLKAEKEQYLKINLTYGNLNNQKMSFLNACRIAAKNNFTLIEPFFLSTTNPSGKYTFLLSDIFDFDYFVKKTEKYFKITKYTDLLKPTVEIYGYNLFWAEMEVEEKKRIKNLPYIDEIEIAFYESLKLNKYLSAITDEAEKSIGHAYTAIHVRIEDDWTKEEEPYDCGLVYVNKEKILEKYKSSEFANCKNVYLATSYQGQDLLDLWFENGYCPHTHHNLKSLDQLELSAISFELCVRAEIFIGNNESSFSNLATHTRHILRKGPSYAYNSKDNLIYLRNDFGLHLRRDVCKFMNIKNYPHSPNCKGETT